jgi:phosphoserine phosphatase
MRRVMQIALTFVIPDKGMYSINLGPLKEALAAVGAYLDDSKSLGFGVVDLIVEGDLAAVRSAVDEVFPELSMNHGVEHVTGGQSLPLVADYCVQPAEGRRKRLLVADMDSTIINVECLDELADFAGVKDQVSAITERAMRGELAFEGALRERVAMLQGLPLVALQRAYDERVRLNPGARTLVRTMAAHGARCTLVSGGFTFFTSRVAQAAGFHDHQANTLNEANGALTGEVGEPILGREAKLWALTAEAAALGIELSQTLAIGDGANDLAMIEAAGLGVAYRAKPIVAAQADARVDHADLTTLLYFQGYSADQFVID